MKIRILDNSLIPYISMVIVVIFLIVSLPYFLGRALDDQTEEIAELRQSQLIGINSTLANMTAIGQHNEAKIDMLLGHFNMTTD